jgi:UDP-N-acetyl-2-amino-2-deoxyglucuronate dehydrogenase
MFITKPFVTDRRIRFALVGCGRISENHLAAIDPHFGKSDGLRHDQVRSDRRFPGSVRGGFWVSHAALLPSLDTRLSPECRKVQVAQTLNVSQAVQPAEALDENV